jgi:hypothetical protein
MHVPACHDSWNLGTVWGARTWASVICDRITLFVTDFRAVKTYQLLCHARDIRSLLIGTDEAMRHVLVIEFWKACCQRSKSCTNFLADRQTPPCRRFNKAGPLACRRWAVTEMSLCLRLVVLETGFTRCADPDIVAKYACNTPAG